MVGKRTVRILFSNEVNSTVASCGLLLLRVSIGGMMLLLHGLPKLIHFQGELLRIEDPFGLGAHTTLVLTTLQEIGLSSLLIIGLATRLAALPLAFTMVIAGFIVHGDWSVEQRQFIFLYLIAFLTIALAGPGRLSLDDWLKRRLLPGG